MQHKEINNSNRIATIGYEGKNSGYFIRQLILHKVNCLVDVRNNAFSMKPGFSKKSLQRNLEKASIEYRHFKELGVEPKYRKNLDSKQKYRRLFAHYKKQLETKGSALQELMALIKNKKIALMCFEVDKDYCHRSILAEKLRALGCGVEHI